MDTKHPDVPAIDRLGTAAIMAELGITKQAVSYFRKKGVPKQYRKTLARLGVEKGVAMPEMFLMRDRIVKDD